MEDFESPTQRAEQLTQEVHLAPTSTEEPTEGLIPKVTRFLRLGWLKRKMVLGILATGIVLSLWPAIQQPNVYTSTTTLMPPNNTSSYSSLISMLSSASSAASLGGEALGLNSPGELYVGILGSRNVLDGLIARFNLMHYYHAHLMEDARKSLVTNTKVSQDRKSGIIAISVTAEDPVLASNLAQGYVVELNRVVTDDSTSAARRERIFLEGRVKDIKQQLDDSAKALSQFATKSGAIDMSSQAKSMVDAGLKLQTELIEARSQLAAIQQTYSADNARVRAAAARIAALQQQMDELGGRHQVPGSKVNANNSGYPSAGELPSLGLTYFDLERKMRVEEALWEALTKQYETAKVEEAAQIPTIHALDVANVPERKSGPSRRMIMMTGMLLSFLAACIAVVAVTIWEKMDPQEEPKKLITEVVDAVLDRQRWYWSIPGMRWLHNRRRS